MYINVIKANVFWCQRLHLVSSIHFFKLAADYIDKCYYNLNEFPNTVYGSLPLLLKGGDSFNMNNYRKISKLFF